jgi:cation transport ATPase
LAKKLYSSGTVIAGEKAINTITDCDSIILDTCDLFNADNIQLVKMKIFDHNQVDTAIIDAASVLNKADSLFANIFLKIIRNKTDLIKEVTHISINDNLGFNATIEDRNIILGSGKLLTKNHIPIPTKYAEEHWIQNNPNLKMIYLAIDGYLVALFLMQLNPLSKIVKYINNLQRQNIRLIFKSKDPLVSVNTVSSVYNIDNDLTNNISAKDPPTNKNFVGISYTGSMSTFVSSIASSITARNLILFTTVIGIISILLGLTLISVFVSLNAIKNLSLINLVIFQISWFTLGTILHSWRKV